MKIKKVLWTLTGVTLLLLAATATAAYFWVQKSIETPYGDHQRGETVLLVEPGSGAAQILRQMESQDLIVDYRLARLYLEHKMGNPPLQAGEYRFTEPLTLPRALEKLVRGDVVTYGVTIVEGLTAEETAAHLSAEGFGDQDTFLQLMSSPQLIADLDPLATNLEGYLFPDTYRFPRQTSEQAIVKAMVANFRTRWQDQVAPLLVSSDAALDAASAEQRGASKSSLKSPKPRTIRDIVTLASIVEKEAQIDSERGIIAGVYSNRLRRGIALYADPTVIFALRLEGRWDGNLRRADLQMDSPYNTYRYPGLPPGPIASSGLASLQAAARPADVPYIYFVSRNDGTHVFSKTLAEHNRNVNEWQKRYWRQRLSRQAK